MIIDPILVQEFRTLASQCRRHLKPAGNVFHLDSLPPGLYCHQYQNDLTIARVGEGCLLEWRIAIFNNMILATHYGEDVKDEDHLREICADALDELYWIQTNDGEDAGGINERIARAVDEQEELEVGEYE